MKATFTQIRSWGTFFAVSSLLVGANGCMKANNQDSLRQAQAGPDFFANSVAPSLRTRCIACHSPNGIATDDIYDYDPMRAMLANGASRTQNELVEKTRNVITHGGGNQCTPTADSPPCSLFQQWWDLEFSPASAGGAPSGALDPTISGNVLSGWAADADTPSQAVTVKFYINGPIGVGTLAGEAIANLPRIFGVPIPGNHEFQFTIPAPYRDGVQHPLYAYAADTASGQLFPINTSPFNFTLYTPTAAGQTYFTNNVRGRLAGCLSCHSTMQNYASAYSYLAIPSKAAGGTSTNNNLYIKANGGNGHSGGNFCGSVAGLCPNIATWWGLEFP
ncbi:MAG: hypothetical protein AB7P04_07055 [Bacteriovoracia bacterium]